ncbi:MAG: hypothetical protein R3E84_07930 [Pseudomonadales bacterium]|nr:hypothetical protein [Pseudomonadales bacterium]
MSSSDDIEGNSWPGFVDILSATIMMFMFFVLITAVALFFHVITFTSREDPVTVEELEVTKQQVVVLEEQNDELRKKVAGLEQKSMEIDASFSESEGDQNFKISDDGMTLTVFFGANSITVTQDTSDAIVNFVNIALSRYGGRLRANITSPKTRSSIETVARKVAVARILNTRNSLLKTELARQSIMFGVKRSEKVDGDYNWAQITLSVAK